MILKTIEDLEEDDGKNKISLEFRHNNKLINEDKYYLGLSFPQFLNLTAKYKSLDSGKELFSIKRFRHIYAVGGIYIPFDFFGLGDETAILDLSTWVRYLPGQLPVIDGNIRYQHNQTFWFGTGVSYNATSHFEGGFLAGYNRVW